MASDLENGNARLTAAMLDAVYPLWLANGRDLRAALSQVHQSDRSPSVRDEAWASLRMVIEWPLVAAGTEGILDDRARTERVSA